MAADFRRKANERIEKNAFGIVAKKRASGAFVQRALELDEALSDDIVEKRIERHRIEKPPKYLLSLRKDHGEMSLFLASNNSGTVLVTGTAPFPDFAEEKGRTDPSDP